MILKKDLFFVCFVVFLGSFCKANNFSASENHFNIIVEKVCQQISSRDNYNIGDEMNVLRNVLRDNLSLREKWNDDLEYLTEEKHPNPMDKLILYSCYAVKH